MAYRSLSWPTLGLGVDLRSAVDKTDLGFAIDLMNVQFGDRGSILQRSGYDRWSTSDLTTPGNSVDSYYESDGTRHLLVGAGGNVGETIGDVGEIVAYNMAGAASDTISTLPTGAPFDSTRFGAPETEETYLGNGFGEMIKYDGTSFTALPDNPSPGALAVTTNSNRLVATAFRTEDGGPEGSPTTNPSTVWFSDPGAPDTWSAGNYVQLHPGDGEQIQAAIAWGSYIIIFKESKFFVFTGETTSDAGTPVFNYYVVDTGHGAASPNGVSANEHGVVFWDRGDGLMITQGGQPKALSERINPVFRSSTHTFWKGGHLNWEGVGQIAVNTLAERVYINFPVGDDDPLVNNRTLVYDMLEGWWTIFDVKAQDMVAHSSQESAKPLPYFVQGLGVYDSDGTQLNDDGVAITSRWSSGWNQFDSPNEKKIRQAKIWGTGHLTFAIGADYKVVGDDVDVDLGVLGFEPPMWADGTNPAWIWGDGTDPTNLWGPLVEVGAITGATVRPGAIQGTYLRCEFVNRTADSGWGLHAIDLHEATVRQPSVAVADAGTT